MPNDQSLQDAGWRRFEPVTGDASLRRYTRVWNTDGRTAILVEYPPPVRRQLPRDLEVFSWCRRRGLRVPDLFSSDLETGRALIEDLGVADAEVTLEATPGAARLRLFHRMLEPLETLARCEPGDLPPWNPPLDRERLRWELAGFELWYLHHYRSRPPSPELSSWLDDLAREVGNHPRRVCHRDYHLNNLLIQDGGAVGVIDIQDILVGPDTYDVVSLVAERAAARLISSGEQRSVLDAWAQRTGASPGWRERAALVRVQRGLKVLGTFARFILEGRTEYRRWLTDLEMGLAAPMNAVGASPDVTAFLLD